MTQASSERSVSRRDFVRWSGLAAGAVAVAACTPPRWSGLAAGAPAGDESSGEAVPAEDMEVVVEAWAHWEQGLGWIQNAMDNYGFSDENPHITWNPVVAPLRRDPRQDAGRVRFRRRRARRYAPGAGRMAAFFKGDEICFIDMTDRIGDRLDDFGARFCGRLLVLERQHLRHRQRSQRLFPGLSQIRI